MASKTRGSWLCACGAIVDDRARACAECGIVRPTSTGPRATVAPGDSVDPARCHWRGGRGRRCLMRGTVLYGAGESPTRFCGWHDELRSTPDRPKLAEDFAEFERWCRRLRDRGYCGVHFEWSHADPVWLFQLVTGDITAAFEPPSRVGGAKTSCYYGWNGQRVADAFPPIPPARAERPLTPAETETRGSRATAPTARPIHARGFVIVHRAADVTSFQCLTCRGTFGREPDAPAPRECPRAACPSRPRARAPERSERP